MTLANRVARLETDQRTTGFCKLCYLLARATEDEATARAAGEHTRHTLEELLHLLHLSMEVDRTSTAPPAPGYLN
jgi:hypothetical protein